MAETKSTENKNADVFLLCMVCGGPVVIVKDHPLQPKPEEDTGQALHLHCRALVMKHLKESADEGDAEAKRIYDSLKAKGRV